MIHCCLTPNFGRKVVPRFLMNGTMATFMGNAIEQFGIRGQMEET